MSTYTGLFGRVCEHIPLFDVSAPDGWTIDHRSYGRTSWYHPEAEIEVVCERTAGGWNVQIKDCTIADRYQVLPVEARRWNAFGAARDFLEGETLLLADRHSNWDGPISIDLIRDSR